MTTELDKLKAKVAEAVARRDAATQAKLSQGCLLETTETRRWTNAQKAEVNAAERKMVFANFSSVDRGRGRHLVARFEDENDAALFAAHHADIETMQELLSKVEAVEAENAELRVKLDKASRCKRCAGTGYETSPTTAPSVKCWECHGAGVVLP